MEARAIQRTVRQSARKMRLVIDQIRGQAVPQAYAILRFSKKLAAKQIHKVLKSAVANAEQRALRERSEEHTSELQSRSDLVCRLLLEKKKKKDKVPGRLTNDMMRHSRNA